MSDRQEKKNYILWQNYLCGVPQNDYINPEEDYSSKILKAASFINDADYILIGGGAGLSSAAGLVYSGKRFKDNFQQFIDKYGEEYMTDMYTGGFYPFPTEEAKWGYWSKYVVINRFLPSPAELYTKLYNLVKNKDYFVLTTNVDGQFANGGFDEKRIFFTQGDFAEIQCAAACHNKVYNAKEMFLQMDKERKDCLVPSSLVPCCPVCGGRMEMHLRSDEYFIEDEAWNASFDRYREFLSRIQGKKAVLIELGVGFNTPVIIRFPFEKMMKENKDFTLIRLNKDESFIPQSVSERSVGFSDDMNLVIKDLLEKTK